MLTFYKNYKERKKIRTIIGYEITENFNSMISLGDVINSNFTEGKNIDDVVNDEYFLTNMEDTENSIDKLKDMYVHAKRIKRKDKKVFKKTLDLYEIYVQMIHIGKAGLNTGSIIIEFMEHLGEAKEMQINLCTA